MAATQRSAIGFEDLSVVRGRRVVLSEINARVPELGITTVVGGNGAGKSTLLGVIAGVIKATTGTLTRHGPGRVAHVMQRTDVPDALPLTVRETVAMGRWERLGPWRRARPEDRRRVEEAMADLGIDRLADRRLDELSGGQRQRALVAQALVQDADLLLLDEPTTGLDAAARADILAVLDGLPARGVTVVHATHDPEAARRAGHCLALDAGTLLAQGPPAEVLTAV
ncbi:zinc ABC transporter ATP-binding protein AztA [Streptomyces sp. ST2-7A]|uniref:zinc ABC transporter ATP-binding protein AztA n=1 Tax=Streptomyces sp. ST2-7A TaxID=2907214 RepID=UPI001F2956DE|nr:zinc ABC transporter ATP-binding protein AztA [Streptomyces sp. ST2-7A]MCE7081810.1 metal ABC transporter ATP-binding protein [Streptomyces sp. ST2-7A]